MPVSRAAHSQHKQGFDRHRAALIHLLIISHLFGQGVGTTLPEIVEHPEDSFVTRNDPVTLRCDVRGDPEPRIKWLKDGKAVVTAAMDHKSHRVLLPNGSLFFLRAVQSRKENDAGVYQCLAENSLGQARSRNATLVVAVLKDKFRLEPSDVGATEGSSARLECAPPKGSPVPTVFWKKDGKIVDVDLDRRLVIEGEGTLVIRKVSEADEGKYQCLAKNAVGTRGSLKATLTFQVKPHIIKHPENISAVSGDDIRLGCVVGGKPKPEVRWSRRSGQLPASRSFNEEDPSVGLHVLHLREVAAADEDEYFCLAENKAGSARAVASVTVHSPPVFLVRPSDQRLSEASPVKLECVAAGNPVPTLFWMKEGGSGVLLPGARQDRVKIAQEGTLTIDGLTLSDVGFYSCGAVSTSGSALARAEVRLSTSADDPPPIIQLGPSNQTVPEGASVRLPCQSSSPSNEKIVWLKDGVPLDKFGSDVDSRIEVASDNTLTIRKVGVSDSGLYSCQVRSASGQAVMSAALTIIAAPSAQTEVPGKNSSSAIGGSFAVGPGLADIPGSPSRPALVAATASSLEITWDKPIRMGSSPLKGYQIEYYNKALPTHWVTLPDLSLRETHNITNLQPSTTIVIVVRARNSHGVSPPSPLSRPMSTSEANSSNPRAVRERLGGQRLVELQEVTAIGPRKVKLSWKLLIPSEYIEGYHIQIKDSTIIPWPSNGQPEVQYVYDVITIAGGGTRSHTLSDLRPDTKYSIFLLPFFRRIKGMPSNLKTVTTKEDVPSTSPEGVKLDLVNATAAIVQWHPPPRRDLHGELKGFKVLIDINGTEVSNFTLEADANSLILYNISQGLLYAVQVAAYNRQGVGPFSDSVELLVDSEQLFQRPLPRPEKAPGLDLAAQEVWFVSIISFLAVLLLVGFLAIVCIRRKSVYEKSLGHYNVPVHKVDDITHANFTDRDHLWFDTSWGAKSRNSGNGNCQSEDETARSGERHEDPMAEMLENNAKNKNAHLFVNNLHNLKSSSSNNNNPAPEYAEVEGVRQQHQQEHQQGPYATTTLVEPSPSLQSNSTCPSVKCSVSPPDKKSSWSAAGRGHEDSSNKDTSGSDRSSRSHRRSPPLSASGKGLENSLPPPPLPPPINAASCSPFSSAARRQQSEGVTNAPVPPLRGVASYNGVLRAAGSVGSFGHQLSRNAFTCSQCSVPNVFYGHHHHRAQPHQLTSTSCCASPAHVIGGFRGVTSGYCSGAGSSMTDSMTTMDGQLQGDGFCADEQHYESASVCYGNGDSWRDPRFDDDRYNNGGGWDSSAYLSEDGNESVYALESEGGGEDEEGGEDDFMAPRRAPQPDQALVTPVRHAHIRNSPRPHHRRSPYNFHPRKQWSNRRQEQIYQQQRRPLSSCSTDSNYSNAGSKRSPAGRRRRGGEQVGEKDPGQQQQPIYSTFRPVVEMANASTATEDSDMGIQDRTELENEVSVSRKPKGKEDQESPSSHSTTPVPVLPTPTPTAIAPSSVATEEGNNMSEFAKVSEDMSELVNHLNSIQSDMSELAGRPISVYENGKESLLS